jgi:crotonobetainyl-CoA:carnitine CoA-transferase CaiB-like acyl-CoA transferase
MRTAAGYRAGFLAGVRVLELGDGVAGAAATSLLWSLGAEVVALTDPSSPHRRGRPRVVRDGDEVALLSIVLDRGKRLVAGGSGTELPRLIAQGLDGARFDIVIVDRVLGPRGVLSSFPDLASYSAFAERHNPRAWVTISAFGSSGERADDIATELTVAAAGGMLAAARDQHTGLPLKLAGQQSLLNTGQAGALAACHALDLTANGGSAHLDLSATEVTVATGPVLEVGGVLLNTGSVGGAKRYGAPASFYECRDGLIRISAMEDHQWRGVVTAMGSPAWAERFSTVEARIEAAEQVDEHVAAWTRELTKQDAETVLQSHGVPATAVYSPAEILHSPQLAHRGAFERLATGAGEARVIGVPFRVVAGGSKSAGGDVPSRRSLRGLRVLEASRVLALPLAGSILGALGAEVTKVEDLPRLDMYRRRGPYIDGEPGIERSAYFALMNHSKRSAAFDVDARRDRLDAMISASDVVLENLGPKRALSLELAASVAPAGHAQLLAVSSSGFGQDGPHAAYRAYAYNLQASCALGYLTRTAAGDSAEIDIAWADLIAAYSLATIIAAWAVGPEGNAGVGLDFAMADLVISHFNEFIAAASLDPDLPVDTANDLSPYAPNGVYPTVDGWVAVSVEGDEQFARFTQVLGSDAVDGAAFAGADARHGERRSLDARIADATRTRSASELASALRAVGVPAEKVASPADLLDSPQLASRGFFTPVEHGEWGERRLVGIPWRRLGGPPIALGAPPCLQPLDEERV